MEEMLPSLLIGNFCLLPPFPFGNFHPAGPFKGIFPPLPILNCLFSPSLLGPYTPGTTRGNGPTPNAFLTFLLFRGKEVKTFFPEGSANSSKSQRHLFFLSGRN